MKKEMICNLFRLFRTVNILVRLQDQPKILRSYKIIRHILQSSVFNYI